MVAIYEKVNGEEREGRKQFVAEDAESGKRFIFWATEDELRELLEASSQAA